MTTTTIGTFYLRKQQPVEATADERGFRLTLRLLDRQGPGAVEPYVATWRGPEAKAWWARHAQELTPGTPLQLQLHNPRSFTGPRGQPETHASVVRLELAPLAPSWRGAKPITQTGQLATT